MANKLGDLPVPRIMLSSKKQRAPRSPKSPAAKSGKTAKAAKAAAAAKIPKIQKAKSTAEHPTYLEMVTDAIATLKDRKGASRQAIYKHIVAAHSLVKSPANEKKVRHQLAQALKKGTTTGSLLQASQGRFKIQKAGAASPKAASTRKSSTPKAKTTPKSMKKVATSPSEKKAKSPKQVAKPSVKKSKKAPVKKEVAEAPATPDAVAA
ncbi:unnamed protein product [Caenorhabditis brenneri]